MTLTDWPSPTTTPAIPADAGQLRRWVSRIRSFVSRSLRNQLILLTALAVGLGALISSIVVYQVAQRSLHNQFDDELLATATAQAPVIAAQLASDALPTSEGFSAENVILMVVQANRDVVVSTGQTPLVFGWPEISLARLGSGIRQRTGERTDGVPYRMVSVPFEVPVSASHTNHYVLILGRDLAAVERTLSVLRWMQLIAGLIGVLVGTASGIALARSSLRSIRQLSHDVAQITATDQLEPVSVSGADEVAQLSRSFNSLLNSLATSRERQRRLLADASHELRTPLTSLRTNVELLIADENSGMLPPGARGEILHDIAEQVGEFTSLIADLVALSREDGLTTVNRATIDFQDVVRRAITRAQRRGPNLVFAVDLEPTWIEGDAAALERAVTNLLDNAVKFSPDHGQITVLLSDHRLRIRDQGPGIADEDLPHIFERFYRSDRSRNTPGTGLGLSIVDHTVTSHGGIVRVERPADGGAEFVVWLPPVPLPTGESPVEPRASTPPPREGGEGPSSASS
ncbi:MAG: HAMP domain-containing histidine kinase [Propionibacteriaceae bacterium]|jgi:two-component system sensor histidine kinase MprB|nr:HAMP domain-containing histidine kinase [Propionibacteriaceae bacterium]